MYDKEYARQYRLNNKEKIKERRKQYRIKNREKLIEKLKQWRLENSDKVKEYSKQYNKINKEKIDENARVYYLKNKEKILPLKKKYQEANKEHIREKNKIWRQNHQIYFIDKKITVDFIERSYLCICCRFQGSTNLHHLKYDLNDPLKHTVELCDSCHVLWHMEEHYLRFGKKGILPSEELMVN